MAKIQSAIAQQFPERVIPLINAASTTIDIVMYQWKWYGHESAGGVQKLNLAVLGALRRRVKVRVLLNTESMGHAITKINAKTASHLQMHGAEIKFGQVGVITHAKMLIIDGRILVLGSHNFSKGAFSRNQEASIIVESVDEIKPYRDYFDGLWRQFT
ncbi:MAG TPA: phospholipase D-like domain-containing protein [Patescibacteria group bacterium]|nr:phospholipase D-like domain-containing protein [Patescibacteria group bacterium]